MSETIQKKIEVVSIHSQKGGVGKTSVALAKAAWSAFKDSRKTLIIDGDVTGTSLVDLFSLKDKPHYLNALLLADPRIFKQYRKNPDEVVTNYCSPVDGCDNIFFIPSSPILDDIKVIVSLISQEDKLHFFKSRMKCILEILGDRFETIIIDTPPGIYGMSKAIFDLEINDEKYEKQSFFLTSLDKVDYRALFSLLSKIYLNMPKESRSSFYIFFNKLTTGMSRNPVFRLKEISEDLKLLLKERAGNDEILEKIRVTFPFANDFDMERILSTTRKLIIPVGDGQGLSEFERWCLSMRDIGKDVQKGTL